MKEPKLSCPTFDSVIDSLKNSIDEIEEARKINSDLRQWGQYWKDKFEELDKDTDNRIHELKSEIAEYQYKERLQNI